MMQIVLLGFIGFVNGFPIVKGSAYYPIMMAGRKDGAKSKD
jgi:hypothetical protein